MAKLQASSHVKLGSRDARKLRLQGKIPCSIQGEGKDNVNVAIDSDEFMTARRHHEHLFDIEVEGGGAETVLVRELQWDAFGERINHVEFRRVVRGRKTEAEVELEFTGHPKGILNQLLTHVTVMALPTNIPDSIEVKVEGLEPGHPIHISDLEFPEGVSSAMPEDTPVAVVSAPKGEEEETAEPVEGEEAAEGEEPKPEAGGESED